MRKGHRIHMESPLRIQYISLVIWLLVIQFIKLIISPERGENIKEQITLWSKNVQILIHPSLHLFAPGGRLSKVAKTSFSLLLHQHFLGAFSASTSKFSPSWDAQKTSIIKQWFDHLLLSFIFHLIVSLFPFLLE